jgi:hypothetical protein
MTHAPIKEIPIMTSPERRRELARLLAVGLLRHRDRPRLLAAATVSEKFPESSPNCLELAEEMRLSVQRG